MRLDLWLWSVRVYKTRALSAEAIKTEGVQVDGKPSKPAHAVRAGEIVTARIEHGAAAWTRTLRVLDAPTSRVGAKLVPRFAEDLTSAAELEKRNRRELYLLPPGLRAKGSGRPTKRERRETDEFGAEPDEADDPGDESG